ncbi:nucleotidyltransferase family protein [Candidatus Fermentibacteria bacterium]|nr:nucleotidyltransferase family protein [Candidatus Fermentibacteria bacterium]
MRGQLELLVTLLQETGIRVLLIGGYALQAYGVVRQTIDIDLLLADEGADDLASILAEVGYRETARSAAFRRFVHDSPAIIDVDLLLVDETTLVALDQDSAEYRCGSAVFRVPSLPHLVALKLHAAKHNPQRRLREAGDIVALVKAHPDALPVSELRRLCERYGPPGLARLVEEDL